MLTDLEKKDLKIQLETAKKVTLEDYYTQHSNSPERRAADLEFLTQIEELLDNLNRKEE